MQDGAAYRGFTAAALPHQTQGFTLVDGERYVIHSLQGSGAEKTGVNIEVFLETLDFNKRLLFILLSH